MPFRFLGEKNHNFEELWLFLGHITAVHFGLSWKNNTEDCTVAFRLQNPCNNSKKIVELWSLSYRLCMVVEDCQGRVACLRLPNESMAELRTLQ